MTTDRIQTSPREEGVAFEILTKPRFGKERPVPVEEWSGITASELVLPLGRLIAWRDEGTAHQDGLVLVVPHAEIAALSDHEARSLGLPPPPAAQLHVDSAGTIDQSTFKIRWGFRDLSGRPLPGYERTGSWLQIGAGQKARLPGHMYWLIDAIDDFNRLEPEDEAERWRRWMVVQQRLPGSGPVGGVVADGYLESFRILHGSAFSIDPETIGGEFDVDPVIMAAGAARADPAGDDVAAEAQPLLAPRQHERFIKKRFRQSDRCRAHYTLEDGVYLVLDPIVQEALDVVRRVQLSDRATRRDFVRNPRTYLKNALGERFDEGLIEDVFVETSGYSERVRDVGLWVPEILPWVKREGSEWFPDGRHRPSFGIKVGKRFIEVQPPDLDGLRARLAEAREQGEDFVKYRGEQIPTTEDAERALDALAAQKEAGPADLSSAGEAPGQPEPTGPEATPPESLVSEQPDEPVNEGSGPRAPEGPQVLVIEGNLDSLDYERTPKPRNDQHADESPAALRTKLKPHQREGLAWLQQAWRAGAPGVLLADDMGLGKTLQCLAFFEWLQRVQLRASARKPLLIVAPTSLLENWIAEHQQHLHAPGIGDPLKVWGRGLADLRTGPRGAETALGHCVLDRRRLADAEWLLTTYETLRDYQHSLCAIRFAAAVFDEIQKIKNPGALVAHAAKAVNADFVIGLSGTPVENRLADLWSILDRVHEGYLEDLKSFSARFEAPDVAPAVRASLKTKLTDPAGPLPPIMLRRMKADHLPGLPVKSEQVRARAMPRAQADAYAAAVEGARRLEKGAILQALQGIRSVSLHPHTADQADAAGFIDASARWQVTFEVLEEIARTGEKALIFLEAIELQRVLATLIRSRFGLPDRPRIINGQVAGNQRQCRVSAFQDAREGFGVIILGPRAAGIGLTLTAANHVIHLSRWWNPAVEDQCTDRVYRIGQTRPVHVHVPQAIWPDDEERSFDRRLHKLLQRKRLLSRDLLAAPAATEEDARDLYTSTIAAS